MEGLDSMFANLMKVVENSKQLENSAEALEQSTNLEALLLGQVKDKDIQLTADARLIDMWMRFNHFTDHQPLRYPVPPFHDLRPQDRLECSALASAPNHILRGKYLLCQTISPVTKIVGFKVVVTDPKGSSGMELVLYNYSSLEESVLGVDLDDILPPGSFLVLKNPGFKPHSGRFVLLCDNPAQVQLVSRKRVQAKFPDLEWEGEMEKMTMQFFGKRHFWEDLEEYEAVFSKLKGLGNKGFVDKRFSDAIRFYDMALDYCAQNREHQAMIHSNKSAALLALGCFNTALKCAEFALEVDPSNEKYNYRKTKALSGLGKYEEGLSFLGAQFDKFPSLGKNKDCKILLDNVKFLASRKNIGPTESQIFSIRMKTLKKDDNIPEFLGPLAVAKIEGKGRGLIATQDIHPGQLLISTKAFCYRYKAPPSSSNQGNTPLLERFETEAVEEIANKLAFDPELGLQFYNLTAGSELGHLEAGDWKNGQVDLKRISEIVKINSFVSGAGKYSLPEKHEGLWILPSFLNHSCSEYNAYWDTSKGWLIMVAIAEIKKGDEVTVAYVRPVFSYDDRQEICKSHGFTCTCPLCQLDAKEPISVKTEREDILQSLGQLTFNSGPKEIKKAFKGVEKLVSFRKDNAALNFPLLSPQILGLGEILLERRWVGEAIWLFSRMHEVAAPSACWYFEGIDVAVGLACCHAAKGDRVSMKKWTENAKQLAIKLYGRLEFSILPFGPLKEKFGIDFFN